MTPRLIFLSKVSLRPWPFLQHNRLFSLPAPRQERGRLSSCVLITKLLLLLFSCGKSTQKTPNIICLIDISLCLFLFLPSLLSLPSSFSAPLSVFLYFSSPVSLVSVSPTPPVIYLIVSHVFLLLPLPTLPFSFY